MKVVSLAIARDGASGGVVRTVTVRPLLMQISCFVHLVQKYALSEELILTDSNEPIFHYKDDKSLPFGNSESQVTETLKPIFDSLL